ncbi:MAG: cupin domain-containing protein [Chloroflexi bacterium]|nr:cupin domain-containing protein [Chloroflexota bacterium]
MEQQDLRAQALAQVRQYNEEAEAYKSPYELWKASQGLPTVRGFQVDNVFDLELTPWGARGGSGVFINLDGTQGFNDSYVYELPPMQSSAPVKHIYDELVFILRGEGTTTVWIDERKKQTFEWAKGSWFAIPPNAWHQYHNLSGREPARYFAMTAAPRVIDTFQSLDFVFNNNHIFTDRFDEEEGYFRETNTRKGHWWATNFIADVHSLKPAHRATAEEVERRARAGAVNLRGAVGGDGEGRGGYGGAIAFVNGTVRCGISFGSQPGVHTAAHRHGPGIHVLTLGGHGYSYLWPKEGTPHRVNWGPGTVFVPPEMWWHAHFNTGPEPWDWLRVGWGTDKPKIGGKQYVYSSLREGGDQIALDEEDPAFHREFEEELAKSGVQCLMLHHPCCTRR